MIIMVLIPPIKQGKGKNFNDAPVEGAFLYLFV